MEGPYRQPGRSVATAPTRDPDAAIIYGVLAVLGVGRVAAALAAAEPFAAEVTIAAAFAVAGLLGLLRGRG